MRCNKCGAELKEGEIYCHRCGNPIQKVVDYSSLEDVLASGINDVIVNKKQQEVLKYNDMLRKDDYEEPIERGNRGTNYSKPNAASPANRKKIEEIRDKKRKKKVKIITLLLALLVVALLGVTAYMLFSNKSYSYQMNKGNSAIDNENYDDAISYFVKASEIEPTKAAPYEGQGRAYMLLADYNSAVDVLKKGIEIEPKFVQSYPTLCQVYEEMDDFDSISDLLADIDDSRIINACKDYYVAAPSSTLKSGSYDEVKTVKLKCKTDDEIYYTLDGTMPSDQSELFTGEIKLEEEGKIELIAVAINSKGIKSKVKTWKYEMNIPVASSPDIVPSTGIYTADITVEMSAADGFEIYYTIDGSEPTKNSIHYTSPFYINSEYAKKHNIHNGNIIIKAIAIENETDRQSSVSVREYELLYLEDEN